VSRRLFIFVGLVAALGAPSAAQTDLDALMARVLAQRDESWKRLQQYVLDEHETFQLLGPGRVPVYGFRHEYTWFLRDGVFIRSPLRADGVAIAEAERRRAEEDWVKGQAAKKETQPGFVSAAYFLKFKFDPGQYALVGRERLDDRDVLRVEYYPTKLFTEGRTRPNRKLRDKDDEIEGKMNKSALVTLWVDPAKHQILQYEFDNIDMDFLPGRSLARVAGLEASMRMGQMFPDVWLPHTIEVRFEMAIATGSVDARYGIEYRDYKLADVTTRVR
jgi:hypothetical protein